MAETTSSSLENAQEAIIAAIASLDVDAIGARIGNRCLESVPEFAQRGDRDLEQETVRAATSNVRAIIGGLAAGALPEATTVPDETLAWVSTLVHRGFGAAVIPRCYTIGQAICDLALREAVSTMDLAPEAKWELAGFASQHLFAYVENISGDMIEHYERERDRWVRGADSVRTELVLAIVEDRPFDPAAASATLRYELNRSHVGFVIWTDARAPMPPTQAEMKTAAAQLLRDFGGTDLLCVPAGSSVVWAWAAGSSLADAPQRPSHLPGGMMAAVGGLSDGVEGFVRSHREARDARRMAGLLGRRTGSIVRYETVALASLLTRDPEAAAQFVARELGALAEDNDANRRMRATLIVFFDEGGSWGKTAKRLGIHQNTVVYRARRAEQLLGRAISERRLELEAALRLAEAPHLAESPVPQDGDVQTPMDL